jgi:hypothetical protein
MRGGNRQCSAPRIVRKIRTLFGLCVRGRGGDGRGHRGLLRRGGRAVGGFVRVATGERQKGGDGKAWDDDFFHEYNYCLVCYFQIHDCVIGGLMAMGCNPTSGKCQMLLPT